MPKVTVIIPTYNRRDYVIKTIDSVLTQTYTDFEVIIIDDGSADGTGEALSAQYGDRIQYVWQENQGESMARNRGIDMAQSTYIAFLDSDDLWLPEKLAKQVPVLDCQPSAGMVFCQSWIIDASGQRIGERPFGSDLKLSDLSFEEMSFGNRISGPSTTLIRRTALDKIDGFDTQIHFGEDWDLWLRMALHYQFAFIPEPLVLIRRHRGAQCYYPSSKRNAQRLADHLTLLEKAFAARSGSVPINLRHRALAHQYAQAFLAEVAVGNVAKARENLQATVGLAPELLQDHCVFGRPLVNQAAIIAEVADGSSFDQSLDYVSKILEHLRAVGIQDRSFEKTVLADTYAMLGFVAHNRDDIHAARDFLLMAIRYNPGWLQNRGVLSVLAKSIVGTNLLNHIQQSVNHLKDSGIVQ